MNERELFTEALKHPGGERRDEYLKQACGNDDRLRERVETLLRSHAQAGSFLEHPAVENVQTELLSGNKPVQTATGTKTVPQIGDTNLEFLQPSDDPQSLGRLDQYEILDVVGRGGMGLVLKARDTELNRIVAVKVLAPELASNATGRMRFGREAQAAAAVSHDHVVPIFAVKDKDGNEQSDLPYLVMEYVDGQSLQQKIDGDGPLELKEILRIGQQVAAGLSAAHLQGLIHRDVKPSNVLLQNGVQRVKITDFGLARAVDDVGITRTGEVAGTPQYMSPEQAQGHALDPRSDLFSLGSVMYAMCTGRGPFRADTAVASLRRVCDDTPRPIREINPDVPIWLVNVIDCLLEKDPQHRYQSAEEVSELLSKCLSRLQEVGPTSMPGIVIPSKHRPAQRPRSRQQDARGKWVVAAMLLLALGMTFSVTEATGVTDFSGTVIRLVTGEGTLFIEVDDPTVQISLDGEELSITGAGLQQLKLRPGEYQVTAMKDGKPFKQELVSISRGGRQVVRVTREADANISGVRIDPPAEDSFVVLSGSGNEVARFATLADAVTGSSAGDTIEIRGNGPFVTEPIEVNHPLRVCAGDGFRPVVRDDPRHPAKDSFRIILAKAPLVLEGVEFQSRLDVQNKIVTSLVSLSATNCRILAPKTYGLMLHGRAYFQNSEIIAATPFISYSESDVDVTNCLLVGNVNHGSQDMSHEQSLTIADSTLVGWSRQIPLFFFQEEVRRNALEQKPIHVYSSGTIFDSASTIMTFVDGRSSEELLPVADARDWYSKRMEWVEESNLYRSQGPYIEMMLYDRPPGTSLVDDSLQWNRYWEVNEPSIHTKTIRYQGGDLIAKARNDLKQLTAADFRLRPDSAGYQAGPNGEDLGANIDFVGPGAAYERWKQTDEYRQWRKETDALMAGEAGQAREPFVVLRGSGSEVGRFATLADAVTGSSAGDTIEVRNNGPFESGQIQISHSLTIRAGEGFHPVITRAPEISPQADAALLFVHSPLVLEGLELQYLAPAPHGEPRTDVIVTDSPLSVAGCRVVLQSTREFHSCCIRSTSDLQITNSAIVDAGNQAAIVWAGVAGDDVVIKNCIQVGFCIFDFHHSDSSIVLDGNTLIDPRRGPVGFRVQETGDADSGYEPNRMTVTHNCFDSGTSVFLFYEPEEREDRKVDSAKWETRAGWDSMLPQLLRWDMTANLYPPEPDLMALHVGGLYSVERWGDDTADWKTFWQLEETGLTEGTIRFQGGDLIARSKANAMDLTLDDFRLRADSAGYQAGPGGEDLGANIDFVGPGAAYERWKQTGEYTEWKAEATELLRNNHSAHASMEKTHDEDTDEN